jgi:hypothetical protein
MLDASDSVKEVETRGAVADRESAGDTDNHEGCTCSDAEKLIDNVSVIVDDLLKLSSSYILGVIEVLTFIPDN